MKYLKLKFLLLMFFALAMAIPPAWAETVTLTNQNIVAAGPGKTGFDSWTMTDGNGNSWEAYAIKNQHSNATSSFHYLQIRKYTSNTAYYIQVPELGTKITKIVMTVSNSNNPMGNGGNNATLFFSSSNSTSATGNGVASGTGASSVTIDCSSLNLNTGYITANGGVRIWDVTVTYDDTPSTHPWVTVNPSSLTINDVVGDNNKFEAKSGNIYDDYNINLGVTAHNDFSCSGESDKNSWEGWGFRKDANREVDGIVTVYYNGRELYATDNILVATTDASEEVAVTYLPDIYIYDDNSGSWNFTTANNMMVYDNGVYTGTITTTKDGACIMFGRTTGVNYGWEYDYNRLFFGADSNGDWEYGTNTSGSLETNPSNNNRIKYSPIKFPKAGEYTITIDAENKTFSIVKAPEPTGPVTYEKVKSTDDLTDGNYLIVYESGNVAFDGSRTTLDNTRNTKSVTIDNESITTSDPIYFTYNVNAKTLKSASGYYIGRAATSNGLDQSQITGDSYVNNITIDEDGDASIILPNQNNLILKYNKNSGQERFRYFTENNTQQAIQLYKEVGSNRVATPTFDPAADTYTEAQEVTISCATDGATIHYTTNGDDPDEFSEVYRAPIYVTETTTIKAIAMKDGWRSSSIAEAIYTILDLSNKTKYTKVTTSADLTDGYYLIVYEDGKLAFDGSLETLDASGNTFDDLVIQSDNIIYTDKEGYFTIDVTAGTIKSASGKYIGNTSDSNDLTASDDVLTNTISIDNGNAVIESEGGAYLRYNATSGQNRFRYFKSSTYTAQKDIQLYKSEIVPVPELGVSLPEAPEEHYKVGQVVKVKATVENGSDNTVLTYKVGEETLTPDAEGNVTLPNKKSGNVELTVTAVDGERTATDSKTYVFDAADELTITLTPATGTYFVGDEQNVTVTVEDAIDANPTITYKFGEEGEAQNYNAETGIVLPTAQAGTINLIVMVDDNGYEHAGATTATGTYTVNHKALTITLNPATAEFTVGAEAKVKVTVENAVGDYVVSGKIGEKNYDVDENGYITLPNDKAVEEMILTVTAIDERENAVVATATGTYKFNAAPAITFDLEIVPEAENNAYAVGDEVKVKATNIKNTIGDYEVTYMVGQNKLTPDNDGYVTFTSAVADEVNLTVSVDDLFEHESEATQTVKFTFDKKAATVEYSAETGTATFGVEPENLPTLTVDPEDLEINYTSSHQNVATIDADGNVAIKGAGKTTITATFEGNDMYEAASDSYELTVAQGAAGLSYPEGTSVTATVGDNNVVKPTLNNPNELPVTWSSDNESVATVDAEGNVTIVGPGTAHITATYTAGEDSNYATGSATYTITVNDVVVALAAPTFAPAAGTYTEPKMVAIACATPGVTIEYTIDGVTKTYDGPFTVDHSCTVTATAKKGTRTVYTPATNSATYTINAVPAAEIADKFYYLQNNALSGKYANVAGRRTLNFVDNADEQAGTVFRVETGADGAVKTLRSQAVDLQGYANRAMAYVPKAIEFVLSTLNNASDVDDATGAGNILGENGVQLILKKFYENFDYNLYVEGTEGAYRIYGRTPSMQHVVDFYHENTAQVEEKLPMLEGYINQVIAKIRSKVPAGMNANVFEDFSLVKVWEKMGGKLIKPEGAENVMAFYRQVLNNKEYVWDFAYQTAMIYLDNIKGTQTYQSIPDEYKAYVEKMQNIRPETKYYMIQNGNEPDYVSENNTKIINNDPSTLWTLTERQTFTVSFPEANLLNGNYYTTLYTDFAYDVPEGVTAYKVTGVNSNAIAEIEAIGKNVPAQTPVLLMTAAAKANVTKTVTLNTNDGTPIENELKGPDYLIKTYEITAPTVESLFAMAAGIVPADMLAQYEYLKLRTSGTVNNKYMWGLSNDDINKCSYLNANNENDCVVRSLDAEEGTVAFSDHWTVATNKAFLVSETNDVIYLSMDTVAEPTFSPVPGSYTAEQQVTITCATEEATIKYSTDGGQTWNTYKGSIAASDDMTIVAKAEKNGMIASNEVTAVYVIDLPTELPDVPAMKGYYQIKNNGNEMYAHVQGRKTLTFTDEPADKAGTVIWLETNDKGQVQSIRSQAADLQGYANRAMNYVPDIVELVADKLNADGVGNLLGHEGLEKIMEKFNESFDHHLYVEQAGENGWRLYGKTPSMQPVVDFYRENTAQVEAKLPMLEDFINSALDKLKEKIGGSSIFTPFSLHQIWENMGETLTEPNDDASIMAFYREVLNNKNYVWDFAYQTAMIYVNNLKNHPRYNEVEDMLGEYAQYINMIEQVRPDFKYYIVQKNDKPDFISEGNVDITKNAARTIWTLEPRTEFNVSIAENLFGCPLAGGVGGYATTLYTDFAYSVPDGVTAYKVTSIEGGNATIEALSGVIPAQTPVLLTAKEAGTATLTLSTEAGTAVTGNLLVGPDYLINEYDLKTEQIQGLFDMIKDKLGQSFYDAYIAQYEHLADLNSGTVNNKYFWGLKESDVEKCSNDGGENCVVRNLEGGKFIDNWKVETNKAFLVTDEYAEITMSILHGDVNHDGLVNIVDVTDLIDRLLEPDADDLAACAYCSDVNQNGIANIEDVTVLIDILLDTPLTETQEPGTGE